MNILTQNVQGLNNDKLQTIRNNLSPKYDILILTETHLKANNLESTIEKLGYRNHRNRIFNDTSPNQQDFKGVSMIIAKRTTFIPYRVHRSGQGNHIIAIGSFNNKPLVLGGFYGNATNCDRQSKAILKSFLDKIDHELSQLTNPILTILGDFNFITDSKDHSNPDYRRKPQTELLLKMFTRKHDLIDTHLDAFESEHPPHTFKRANITSRLDRIYFSRKHAINPIIKQGFLVKSDHTSLTYNWHWKKTSLTLRFPDYLLKSKPFLTNLHNSTRELLITNCDNQSLINEYHDTTPNHPFLKNFHRDTVKLRSSKLKDLTIAQYPDNSFHDQSTDFKSAKLRLFAEQFTNKTNDTQDSIISLTKLGQITSKDTSSPELVLTTLLSQAVGQGMNHARRTKIRKTKELQQINEKLLRYTTHNLPHDRSFLNLSTKRDQLQETLNYHDKFKKMPNTTPKIPKQPPTSSLNQTSPQDPPFPS